MIFIRSQFVLFLTALLVNLSYVTSHRSAENWPSKATKKPKAEEHHCRHRYPTFDEVPHPVKIEHKGKYFSKKANFLCLFDS